MHVKPGVVALAAGAAIAVVAAFWIAQGIGAAAIAAGWCLGFAALFGFGRPRSETLRTASGAGDERTRDLHGRALAFSGFVMWLAATGWWIGSVIAGAENATAGVLAAVFAVSYLGGAAWFSRRG